MEQYKVASLEQVNSDLILSLIERYKIKELPRLSRLKGYYVGKSDIKKRKMNDPAKPNNKIDNPFGAYIVDTVQGYFLGKPVSYQSDDEQLMEKLQLVYDQNHEQTHNSKMGKMLSITGVAYELIYVNEQNEIKFAMIDPEEVFMIYDNSIEQKPLCAVRFYEVDDYVNEGTTTHIELYTHNMVYYYKKDEDSLVLEAEHPHYFKDVPVVCYTNTDEMTGDYEKVIDLINAYNLAVSDTANNLEYFADSYLILSNVEMDAEDIATMKENRVMLLGENGRAEWLVKGTDNVEIEEYKDRLKEDIHTFSHVPNISDESFGNATSGESLKYKLFSLENAVSVKERNFTKGLEQRIKLIVNIFNIKGGNHAHTDVVMKFTRNLPANTNEMANLVTKLDGILSRESLISLLPFVEDVKYEIELLEKEQEDSLSEYSNFNEDEHEGA